MAIGGPQDTVQPRVNVGVTGQPLVTSAEDVVTPDAVQQLVNSVRTGVINTQDIMDRVGAIGQTQRKATLEQLQEYVDPEVIQARMDAARASGASARLTTAQANAAQALVQPIAQKQAAELWNKAPLDAWTSLYPAIKNPDGTTNTDAMTTGGQHIINASRRVQMAMQMLQGTPVTRQDEKGNTRTVLLNPMGDDVTPMPGNRARERWSESLHSALEDLYNPDFAHAAATGQGGAQTGIFPVQSGTSSEAVTPKAAAPAAVSAVEPAAGPGYEPMSGFQTKVGEGYFNKPEEIATALRQQKAYENWDLQKGFARSFNNTAKRIEAIPVAKQRDLPMNQLDMSLAESIIKLYDPQGTIREFKWDKIAESQPLMEIMKNWQAKLLNNGTLTPETRQRLIDLGYDTIAGRESAVRPHLALAAERARHASPPVDVRQVLNTDDDLRVLNKVPLQKVPADFLDGATVIPPAPGASANTPAAGANRAATAPETRVFTTGPYAGRVMKAVPGGGFIPAE